MHDSSVVSGRLTCRVCRFVGACVQAGSLTATRARDVCVERAPLIGLSPTGPRARVSAPRLGDDRSKVGFRNEPNLAAASLSNAYLYLVNLTGANLTCANMSSVP
jgi:hypothetical protein